MLHIYYESSETRKGNGSSKRFSSRNPKSGHEMQMSLLASSICTSDAAHFLLDASTKLILSPWYLITGVYRLFDKERLKKQKERGEWNRGAKRRTMYVLGNRFSNDDSIIDEHAPRIHCQPTSFLTKSLPVPRAMPPPCSNSSANRFSRYSQIKISLSPRV